MYKIRMKVGKSIFPFTEKLANHTEAEVVEVNEVDEVLRVVDSLEWKEIQAAEVAPAEAQPQVADYKANAELEQTAIPVEPSEDSVDLENIDVDSL